MVRSLWTAATGMIAQQNNMDNIANNLSNVNTTGYKTQTNEFKSLLYQTVQTRTTSANGEQKPGTAQVGLGVRNASFNMIFTNGPMLSTDSNTSFAISGGGVMLADSEGRPVLDSEGNPIILDDTYDASRVTVTADGTVCYPDANNNPQSLGITIGMYQFLNPVGLDKLNSTLYAQSAAIGAPINEATSDTIQKSGIYQNFLEGSNVQVVDEMVNMITTQRAYEFNSKAITASDEMLQQANNLRA